MKSSKELEQLLLSVHRKGYPAYKDTRGVYQFQDYKLSIDHVQGDPFASPSKVSVRVQGKDAGFPQEYYSVPHRGIALADYLSRRVHRRIAKDGFRVKGSGKSGLIGVSRCGQEILKRTGCEILPDSGDIILRMEIGFPASGRTIEAHELIKILFQYLPPVIKENLFYCKLREEEVRNVIWLSDDQHCMREQLKIKGLCAFVANGSVLVRESGISGKPMKNAVAFQSPETMEVSLELPHKGEIKGMGIKNGITVIAGGGYHGKSTLLKALESGVYNHIAGDGREYVATDDTAVKVRAEDGRSVKQVDISMFLNHLPNKRDTSCFSTEDASGSTSQAAGIIEAMEAGARVLLMDEDTCATNLMIRDELMQRVIHREQEPITTFSERIQCLKDCFSVSTILVAGSSGVFFHTADTVIQMDCYRAHDITRTAKAEAARYDTGREEPDKPSEPNLNRVFNKDRDLEKGDRLKLKTMGMDGIMLGRKTVDVRYLEQLADPEQLAALAYLLKYMQLNLCDGRRTLREIVGIVWEHLEKQGFSFLSETSYYGMNMAMPRKQEIFAAFNRYRQ